MPKPNVTRVQSASGLPRYMLYTCPNLWCKARLQSLKPPSALNGASRGLEGGFKGASRGLEGGFEAFRRWSPLRPSDLRPPPPRPQTLRAPLKGASEGGTSEPAPAQAGHMPLKGRCVMHTPSITNTKPPHFSLTLTSSPCLIMSPNMAPFGLKLLGCTSQTPSKNGFSPVRLASMIARTLSFQAIARLLSRPS